MKLSLLGILACPACSGELKFAVLESYPRHDADVDEATLVCKLCAQEYAVVSGVPRLRLPAVVQERGSALRGASDQGSLPGDKEMFLEETMLPSHELSGKLTLDAGCGAGRYSAVALSLDAEVVAVDLWESLEQVITLARTQPKLHAVDGDMRHPPFKKGVFDVVYSRGTLHQADDVRAAFHALASLVKPRGYLSVWLYGKAGPYVGFASNPVKPGFEWVVRYRRLAWWIVLLVTPFYRRRHTKEELLNWYAEEGFLVQKILPHGLIPKPGALGRKK